MHLCGICRFLCCTTNKLITNIEIGITPVALAINPVTNIIYVANYGDNSISVIDGQTNKVIARYSLGFTPVALAINPVTSRIFIADYITGLVSMELGV